MGRTRLDLFEPFANALNIKMKIKYNFLLSIILSACLFCPVFYAKAASNLIANPSLEMLNASGTAPQGWTSLKTGTNNVAFIYPTVGAQNGVRFSRVSISSFTSGNAKVFFAPVAVAAGKKYNFINYYLSTVATPTIAEFTDAAGNKTTQTLGNNAASFVWKKASFNFTAPTNAVNVTIYQQLDRAGIIQTDNYSLVLVPDLIITDNIPNASLEQADPVTGVPLAWNMEKAGSNSTVFIYEPTGHAGSRSVTARINIYTSGDAKWLFTPQAIVPGTYRFSDWYKSNVVTKVAVRVTSSAGIVTTIALPDAPAASSWTAYAATVSIPDNAKTFTVLHYLNRVGTLTVDDYSFVPQTVATGTLIIKKVVVGGTKTAANFSFSVNNATAVAFEADGQNDLVQAPGTYNIIEPAVADYTATYAGCSNVVLASGGTATCTITNTYVTPFEETIPNPSLETADASGLLPLNWATDSWSTGVAGTYETSFVYETAGHTGNRSITATISKCNNFCEARWFFDRQTAAPGQTYTFSDWYKSGVVTRVYVQILTSTGKYNIQLADAPAAVDWTQYTATFVMPADAQQYTVLHTIDQIGTLTTDDYSMPSLADPGFTRGIASINFDDAYQDVYDNAFPTMIAYGVKSTQFVVSGCVNATGGECTATDEMDLPVMPQSQLNEMWAAGHEIGSHTVLHHRLTEITSAEQDTELSQSKTALDGLFPPVTNFASPYGQADANSLALIKQYYRSHRTTAIGYNTHKNFDPYYIQIQYVMPTTTLAEFQSWVDKAKLDKSWLVLLYHSVTDDTGYDYSIAKAAFTQQMAALQASGIPVLTNEQALNEITPQLVP